MNWRCKLFGHSDDVLEKEEHVFSFKTLHYREFVDVVKCRDCGSIRVEHPMKVVADASFNEIK